MRHAFGIPVLTKSHFGKNQSYKVLTPDQQFALLTLQVALHYTGCLLLTFLKNNFFQKKNCILITTPKYQQRTTKAFKITQHAMS